jgi:iron complex transport system substrate-binding protein
MQDPGAGAGLRVRLFRPAGRHRGRADPPGVQVTVFNQRSVARFSRCSTRWPRWWGRRSRACMRIEAMRAGLQAIEAAASRCRGGRACISRNGTSRPSAPSAGCRSWSASPAATTALPSWPRAAGQEPHHCRPVGDRAALPRHRHRLLVRQEIPAREGGRAPGLAGRERGRNGQLFEIKSADILQPGPAALTDGVAQLHRIIQDWSERHG